MDAFLALSSSAAAVLLLAGCFDPGTDSEEEVGSSGHDSSDSLGQSNSVGGADTSTDDATGGDTTTGDESGSSEGNGVDESDSDSGGAVPDAGNACGNGVLDRDEACDDGNAQDGDGCNVDCVVSGTLLWTDVYTGPGHFDDIGHDVAHDGSGGFVVVGSEDRSDLDQGTNIWIRRYDPKGIAAWTVSVDIEGLADAAYGVAVDGSSNIAVTGRAGRSGAASDVWTAMLDPDGAEIWSHLYDSPAHAADEGRGAAFDGSDQLWVAGYETRGDLGEGRNAWIARYGAGVPSWTTSFNNEADGNERCRSFVVNTAGDGACIGTEVRPDLAQGVDMMVRALDSEGDLSWYATHDGPASLSDYAYDGDINDAREVVACGQVRLSDAPGDADLWIGLFGPEGTLLWARQAGESGVDDNCYGVAFDAEGNVVVGGYITAAASVDGWLSKYDANGDLLWTRTHDEAGGDDRIRGLAVLEDGRIIVTGQVDRSAAEEGLDVWVAAFAP